MAGVGAGLDEERLHRENIRLGQAEYEAQRLYLRSFPRNVGIVLGNGCNIHCPHCYQGKNGDNLLRHPELGRELRRELTAFYPYLSTLGMQGGELFALPGFRELIDDASAAVSRPIISISTNGTLIDDGWAERIVRTPFRNVTVSIDGGTAGTYARMRVGADLGAVLENVGRIRAWKQKLGSPWPLLDSFFVIMRSNFREIPEYLRLMRANGMEEVALQTVQINGRNQAAAGEAISTAEEIRELHAICADALARERPRFRAVRLSGLQALFERENLDASFLDEQASGLYPDSDGLGGGFDLCPNPWTTMFLAEDGNVFLCFLSEPIGSFYEAPLAAIWNSPRALAKRSSMVAGRYSDAGCSKLWCSWREGKRAQEPVGAVKHALLTQIREMRRDAPAPPEPAAQVAAVRRLLAEKDRRIAETECLLEPAQAHIDHLEDKVAGLQRVADSVDGLTNELIRARADAETARTKAAADVEAARSELERFRSRRLIRVADRISRLFRG
ncbi:MAG: radical SAM protein [Bryobacteraceae bacterium]